jgi:hypothetical protein
MIGSVNTFTERLTAHEVDTLNGLFNVLVEMIDFSNRINKERVAVSVQVSDRNSLTKTRDSRLSSSEGLVGLARTTEKLSRFVVVNNICHFVSPFSQLIIYYRQKGTRSQPKNDLRYDFFISRTVRPGPAYDPYNGHLKHRPFQR